VGHGHVLGCDGRSVGDLRILREGGGSCVGVERGFGFGRGGGYRGGGEGYGPRVHDLLAVCVRDLDLLAVAEEGCGAAAGGDGLGGGHGCNVKYTISKVELMVREGRSV
jgi:hypothetical protein